MLAPGYLARELGTRPADRVGLVLIGRSGPRFHGKKGRSRHSWAGASFIRDLLLILSIRGDYGGRGFIITLFNSRRRRRHFCAILLRASSQRIAISSTISSGLNKSIAVLKIDDYVTV